jgi:hypothetical protein
MKFEEPMFYTVKEVADILKIKPKTVKGYRTRKTNPIPMVNITDNPKKPQWRIAKKDLVEWLQNQEDPRQDI